MTRLWRVWRFFWSNPLVWGAWTTAVYFSSLPRWVLIVGGFNIGATMVESTHKRANI